jgi:hypothetical protein
LPRRISFGASKASFIKNGTFKSARNDRVLKAAISSNSASRPLRRTFSRNACWNAIVRCTAGEAIPRSRQSWRRASIIPAQSTDFGQRVEQVRHDTHCQMAWLLSARSHCPNCTSRTNWWGSRSMYPATGQPAEHLPHW